jgi:hypothetical protein
VASGKRREHACENLPPSTKWKFRCL